MSFTIRLMKNVSHMHQDFVCSIPLPVLFSTLVLGNRKGSHTAAQAGAGRSDVIGCEIADVEVLALFCH